jgi:hypothetical protein
MGDGADGALAAVGMWDAWLVARSHEGGLYFLCFVSIHWALCWGIDFCTPSLAREPFDMVGMA